MVDTSFLFQPHTLTVLMDQHAGSSGKGKVASFITEHADNWQFCCNTFAPQAGHWVKLDNGKSYFYQTFNSCAYQNNYEKMYIGPGSIIELPAFFREKEENNIPADKIGISPVAAILQDIDAAFERGELDLDGRAATKHEGTMKRGSTCHGVGACNARKVLRRPNVLLARDVPELKEFICDVPGEVMDRLDRGQAGLLEIAQGFALSMNLPQFYPYCTSRSVTTAHGFSDMMVAPRYAGHVILNCRTYPIRINSKKYIDRDTGEHLVWEMVEEYKKKNKPVQVYEGYSGPWYEDQTEITWEELTESSGSPDPIIEMTSVTKLPRRVATWSKIGLEQAVRYNKTTHQTFLSINFMNYVDHDVFGKRSINDITPKVKTWLDENIGDIFGKAGASLICLGTGPLTDDMIFIPKSNVLSYP